MSEGRFRAMGTDVHIVLVGAARRDLERAGARITDLEARWSRFLPDSEIGRLNGAAGHPVRLSEETCLLLDAMRVGHDLTDGLFDPSVHDALVAAGYDRTYDELGRAGVVAPGPPRRSPGLATLELDPVTREARLASGVRVDAGAIGKGLAADLVVAELLAGGVAGVSVSVGGDVRVGGEPAEPAGWGIEVEEPLGAVIGLVGLTDGAAATSTTARRRWSTSAGGRHHVIDPRTGAPSTSDVRSVTVVAGTAWMAEVLATAVLVAGSGGASRILETGGASAMLVDGRGRVTTLGGMEGFLW